MGKNWKSFRYHPGMFKVQVNVQASSSDKIDESAVEELLERIVQEIERAVRPLKAKPIWPWPRVPRCKSTCPRHRTISKSRGNSRNSGLKKNSVIG